ncbi:MAG: hypothetical protein ACO26F_04280 [Burkholderiaceae bacterium]
MRAPPVGFALTQPRKPVALHAGRILSTLQRLLFGRLGFLPSPLRHRAGLEHFCLGPVKSLSTLAFVCARRLKLTPDPLLQHE